jgi:hypothetical protein
MPSHKNQHFVPRCHLAPFTIGCAGAAINVFNVRLQKGISNVPVKQESVMVQSVDPTQSRATWRFIGTAIPFE